MSWSSWFQEFFNHRFALRCFSLEPGCGGWFGVSLLYDGFVKLMLVVPCFLSKDRATQHRGPYSDVIFARKPGMSQWVRNLLLGNHRAVPCNYGQAHKNWWRWEWERAAVLGKKKLGTLIIGGKKRIRNKDPKPWLGMFRSVRLLFFLFYLMPKFTVWAVYWNSPCLTQWNDTKILMELQNILSWKGLTRGITTTLLCKFAETQGPGVSPQG